MSIILLLSTTLLSGCILTDDNVNDFIDDHKPEILPIIERGFLNHGQAEGIKYETDTLEGETSSIGRFQYRQDETITFKVGDIVLATLPVHANFTLWILIQAMTGMATVMLPAIEPSIFCNSYIL